MYAFSEGESPPNESSKRRVAAAEQGQLSLRLQDMGELGQGSEAFHARDSMKSSTSSLGSVTTNIRCAGAAAAASARPQEQP